MSYESDHLPYRPSSRRDHYNGASPSEVHHGYAQGLTQTPFSEFRQQLEVLCNTTAAQNLLASHPGHLITEAIEKLQNAVDAIGAANGRLGPETSWNRPPRANYGPRLNTDFQFPRPHTPNNGSNVHSPHTPPRTPDVGGESKRHARHISDLEGNIAAHKRQIEEWHTQFLNEQDAHDVSKQHLLKARDQLGKSERTVARANKITAEQHEEIKGLRTNVESLMSSLAAEYVRANRLEDAAKQYASLVLLKAKDIKQKKGEFDEDNLRQAKMVKLSYMQEQARVMLLPSDASARQIDAAQHLIATVLTERRELLADDDLVNDHNREAHFLLCNALMRSMDPTKMTEAEKRYAQHGSTSLRTIENMHAVNRSWTLRNAAGLADALARQGYAKDAVAQLKKVWPVRRHSLGSSGSLLEKQLLDTVQLLSCQGSKYGLKALEVVCDTNTDPTKHTLRLWIKLGIAYHDAGHHEHALPTLQKAWGCKREMTLDEQRTTLWALARTQAARNKWTDVQSFLADLEASSRINHDHSTHDGTISGSPTDDEIVALRAATQLNLGAYKDAEATAKSLYNNPAIGVSNVLYPSSMFHHVDTLIRALTKQKKVEKFEEARDVWKDVHKRSKDEGMDRDGCKIVDCVRGAELEKLCKAAEDLAATWEEVRKKVARLRSVDEIREMVREVKGLLP